MELIILTWLYHSDMHFLWPFLTFIVRRGKNWKMTVWVDIGVSLGSGTSVKAAWTVDLKSFSHCEVGVNVEGTSVVGTLSPHGGGGLKLAAGSLDSGDGSAEV